MTGRLATLCRDDARALLVPGTDQTVAAALLKRTGVGVTWLYDTMLHLYLGFNLAGQADDSVFLSAAVLRSRPASSGATGAAHDRRARGCSRARHPASIAHL